MFRRVCCYRLVLNAFEKLGEGKIKNALHSFEVIFFRTSAITDFLKRANMLLPINFTQVWP